MNIENINNYFNKLFSSVNSIFSKDTDNDGKADIIDATPKDYNNFTKQEIDELFSSDYNYTDQFFSMIGMKPKDGDRDGIPDSYENKNRLNVNKPDTDGDGIYDGEEIVKGLSPINADEDGDGVLDGRDAYPKDSTRSVLENDKDTDGDGIGDRFEKYIKTNVYVKDTDNDGLSDAVDENPVLDYKREIKNEYLVNSKSGGLVFNIQNSFLDFVSTFILILFLIVLPFTVFVMLKWYTQIKADIEHYYHLFHDAYGYDLEDDHKKDHGHKFEDIKKEVRLENEKNLEEGSKENKIENNFHAAESFAIKSIVPDIESRWQLVEKYMSDNNDNMWRIGIIEADNILDEALKNIGYMGNSLGDRLQNANFKTIDFAWDAHRVRNKIAHEGVNFTLTEREARKTFISYETVFKDLKVI